MSTEGVPTAEHHNQCPDRALTVEAGIFTVGFSKKKRENFVEKLVIKKWEKVTLISQNAGHSMSLVASRNA